MPIERPRLRRSALVELRAQDEEDRHLQELRFPVLEGGGQEGTRHDPFAEAWRRDAVLASRAALVEPARPGLERERSEEEDGEDEAQALLAQPSPHGFVA
jgi:hypothetical protein